MQETSLIVSIFTALLFTYFIFFKSYFSEKGKNFATKQDVGQITDIVEKIKNELQFITQSKFNIKVEERNALIKFYKSYYYWLCNCIETYYTHISIDNLSEIHVINERLEQARLKSINAYARAELFMNNEEITKKYFELNLKTLEIQNFNISYSLELNHYLINKDFERGSLKSEELANHFKESGEIEIKRKKKFINDRVELYKPVAKLNVELQDLIYTHIQSHLSV